MEKKHVSKNPSLEVISEIEPQSFNAQRTNYNAHHSRHVQLMDSRVYIKSPPPNDGNINQGYAGNSQNSINRESSTPSVGG